MHRGVGVLLCLCSSQARGKHSVHTHAIIWPGAVVVGVVAVASVVAQTSTTSDNNNNKQPPFVVG